MLEGFVVAQPDMPSFAFFFNADTFDSKRQSVRTGTAVPIDYIGAADRRPMKDFRAGDELFIVGLSGNQVHLAGRMIVAGRPMSRSEAIARTGRQDFIGTALICLADPAKLETFDPDLKVPTEIARELELFNSDGEPVKADSLRRGLPDPNLFRACPTLSKASAMRLRALLGVSDTAHGLSQDLTEEVAAEADVQGVDNDRHRLEAIEIRRGQGPFRRKLLEAYAGRCVITKCRVEALLEAAHITPHAELADYRTSNGLLLRADIHTLFDLDLIAVDDYYRVHVSPLLRNSEYWTYDGRQLERFPQRMADQPDRDALKVRAQRLKR
jgi:hypothetical protein